MNTKDLILRRLRAVYYEIGFLRRLPIGQRIGKAVNEWEERKGKGDSPKVKEAWDRQFSQGQWAYMDVETSRYAVIVGYLLALKAADILDMGCAEGYLHRRFKPYGYRRYVGVDISEVAISNIADRNDERTQFVQGDGDTYQPDGQFDAIVFNESLYYLRDSVASLRRYANSLSPGGHLIVSNYTASRRARAVLRDAKNNFRVIDETLTRQRGMAWECVVLDGDSVTHRP